MGESRRPLTVPPGLVTISDIAWRGALVAAGLFAIVWVVLELRLVTVPAVAALLAATVLQPAAEFLRRKGWPSLLATWVVMLSMLTVVVGGISLLVPAFADQTTELGESIDEAVAEVERWLETGPLGLANADLRGALDGAADRLLSADPALLLDGATAAAEVLAGILLALVMLFFFIKDGPLLTDWAVRQMPKDRRPLVREAGAASWAALGAYVRGTLVVGVVNGAVIGIGLVILGVPLALPLAIITAVSAFFPLVGAVVAGALAALVALVSGGLVDGLIVVGLTVAVQQIEGDVLSPLVMGRALKLHPLVILVSLTTGAVTAGLLGAFLAVPLAGVVVAAAAVIRGSPD